MRLRQIVIALALVFALIVVASVAGVGFGDAVLAGCGSGRC